MQDDYEIFRDAELWLAAGVSCAPALLNRGRDDCIACSAAVPGLTSYEPTSEAASNRQSRLQVVRPTARI